MGIKFTQVLNTNSMTWIHIKYVLSVRFFHTKFIHQFLLSILVHVETDYVELINPKLALPFSKYETL